MVVKNKYEFVKLCLNYEICIIFILRYFLFEVDKNVLKSVIKY